MQRTHFIGLGSNLGDRCALLQEAVMKIEQHWGIQAVQSGLYETPAWGMEPGTPPFINQVIAIDLPVRLDPVSVMDFLLEVEREMGRTRLNNASGYASRSIDLDLLAVDGIQLNHPRLILPHPRLNLRRFVLEPLCEIAPAFCPEQPGPTVSDLLRNCPDQSLLQLVLPTP